MNITQTLQKWGNGTGLRLPRKVLEAAQLAPGQKLEISVEGKTVILTPVESSTKNILETMLDGVTPQAVGGEWDIGPDIGAERW